MLGLEEVNCEKPTLSVLCGIAAAAEIRVSLSKKPPKHSIAVNVSAAQSPSDKIGTAVFLNILNNSFARVPFIFFTPLFDTFKYMQKRARLSHCKEIEIGR